MSIRKNISIGAAAKICNVSVKQIRHWSEKGYIPEPERVVCGMRSYRYFGTEDLEIIKGIKSYLDEGYRLPVAAQKAAENISKRGGDQNAK